MERIIKFRAWDKCGETKMLRVEQLSWELHPYGVERIHFHGVVDVTDPPQGYVASGFGATNGSEDTGWVLMQFTGLYDKNGKEIYEGDILKCRDANDNFFNEYVVWNEVHLAWGLNDWDYTLVDIPYESFEVVGNIYENPGLLKDAE